LFHLQTASQGDACTRRDGFRDLAACANEDVIADAYRPVDAGKGADLHAVPQRWVALAARVGGDSGGTEGYTTQEVGVIADIDRFADDSA
jgi:hypothetical protein